MTAASGDSSVRCRPSCLLLIPSLISVHHSTRATRVYGHDYIGVNECFEQGLGQRCCRNRGAVMWDLILALYTMHVKKAARISCLATIRHFVEGICGILIGSLKKNMRCCGHQPPFRALRSPSWHGSDGKRPRPGRPGGDEISENHRSCQENVEPTAEWGRPCSFC